MANQPGHWTVRFSAGGQEVYDVWEGKSAQEVLDKFQEEVLSQPWYDFNVTGGKIRVRTDWIGYIEVHR